LPGSTDEWVALIYPVEGLRTGIAVSVGIAGAHRGPAGRAASFTALEARESRNPREEERIEEGVKVAAGTPAATLPCNISEAEVEAVAGTPTAPLPCVVYLWLHPLLLMIL
jgi:hypothetical protein